MWDRLWRYIANAGIIYVCHPVTICLRYLYIMVSLRHDGMTLKLYEASPMFHVKLLKLDQNLSSPYIGSGWLHYGALLGGIGSICY